MSNAARVETGDVDVEVFVAFSLVAATAEPTPMHDKTAEKKKRKADPLQPLQLHAPSSLVTSHFISFFKCFFWGRVAVMIVNLSNFASSE